jgi:hypothetical protein
MDDDERHVWQARLSPEQYAAFRRALDAGWRIETSTAKIYARYQDLDLAEQVPRVIMYLDLGALTGRIRTLEAFLVKEGYLLAEDE